MRKQLLPPPALSFASFNPHPRCPPSPLTTQPLPVINLHTAYYFRLVITFAAFFFSLSLLFSHLNSESKGRPSSKSPTIDLRPRPFAATSFLPSPSLRPRPFAATSFLPSPSLRPRPFAATCFLRHLINPKSSRSRSSRSRSSNPLSIEPLSIQPLAIEQPALDPAALDRAALDPAALDRAALDRATRSRSSRPALELRSRRKPWTNHGSTGATS